MLKNNHPNRRIAFLDYLRIFAFISVLIGHKFYDYITAFANNPAVHATPRVIANMLLPLVYGGGAGVVLFFLVSGYIITHVLQTERTGEFLIKRVFRIYPLYMVAVLSEYLLLSAAGKATPLSILLPQLLLIGDFIGTPYVLNGVEWTLRLEVVFYIFMAILRYLNLLTNHQKIVPYLLIATTLLCGLVAPIPIADIWSKGYFTIYAPFLLLGSMFYLFEKKQVGFAMLLFFTGLVFYQYYSLIAIYQKFWLNTHFAFLTFLLFVLTWGFREHIKASPLVLLLSDMTFAVYLFHNWFFDYAKLELSKINIPTIHLDIQSLMALFLVCFLMMRYIEKPGIRCGHRVLTKIRDPRLVSIKYEFKPIYFVIAVCLIAIFGVSAALTARSNYSAQNDEKHNNKGLQSASDMQKAQQYLNAGFALFNLGKYDESIAANTKSLQIKPDYAEAYNNICSAYNKMDKWDDAIKACTKAIELKPDYDLAKNNLAWALKQSAIGKSN